MSERIEFGSFELTERTKANVLKCLESGWLTMGPVVKDFEEKWRNLFGYKHARALNSGTSADFACCIALREFLDLDPAMEYNIICPALSFIATANAIRAAGFVPKFVDVEKETLNIDPTKIEAAIDHGTVGIMVVNLMGRPAELDVIADIALRHQLPLIVDNCEAYGSKFKGKFALDYAQMETSSHFLAHIIFSCEGGCVSTNDPNIDKMIEAVRSHGRLGGGHYFNHEVWGMNFKPSDLHASVGIEEVEDFWHIFELRKRNLKRMRGSLVGFEKLAYFVDEDENRENAPHAFSITLKQEGKIDELKKRLDAANIAWKRNFGCMATQHGCFRKFGHKLGDFPNAEYIGDNGIHIGVHKLLTDENLERIQKVVYNFFEDLRDGKL